MSPTALLAAFALLATAAGCRSETPSEAPPRSASGAAPVPSRAEGATWTAALELTEPAGADAEPAALVRVGAREGMHVNEEYPTSFRPAPDANAGFAGARVPLTDVAGKVPCAEEDAACEVTFRLPFVPPGDGALRVAGTLSFSVCSAEKCLIEKVDLAATAPRR